jgi:hypothetical protein
MMAAAVLVLAGPALAGVVVYWGGGPAVGGHHDGRSFDRGYSVGYRDGYRDGCATGS